MLSILFLLMAVLVFTLFVLQPLFGRFKYKQTYAVFFLSLLLIIVLVFAALPDSTPSHEFHESALFPFQNIVALVFHGASLFVCTHGTETSSFYTLAEKPLNSNSFLARSRQPNHALLDDAGLRQNYAETLTSFVVDPPYFFFASDQGKLFRSDLSTLTRVYENSSYLIQCMATNGTHLFLSANAFPILVLDKTSLRVVAVSSEVTGHHAGIFYLNKLLYVCESFRIVAFRNSVLVRIYEPVFRPLHLTIWREKLVVAAFDRTYFFDLHTGQKLYTLNLPSLYVAASPFYLYVADGRGITVVEGI